LEKQKFNSLDLGCSGMGRCVFGKGQITLVILDDHRTDHPRWIQWM